MAYEPIKEETKRLYLKIWSHYAIRHLSQEQLAKLFDCSQDTVTNAVKWCAKNRTQFHQYVLAEAAKEALENRLRELKNDLVRIKEENPINWNAVIGINRIIKDNEELLWKFQAVIDSNSQVNIDVTNMSSDKYRTMLEYEEEREMDRKARKEVNGWTDEQKRSYVEFIKAMELGKKIAIEREGEKTTIVIENVNAQELK